MTTAARRRWSDHLALPRSIRARPATASVRAVIPLWVVICSGLLPIVLTTGWFLADSLQPPPYSPVRQTVSVLSGYAGTDRWIVTAALYIVGAGYLAAAVGMSFLIVPARIGLAVAGVAAVGIASFPVPVDGTNPIHSACTAIGALTIAIWPAIADRQVGVRDAIGRPASIAAMLVSATLLL